jgi:CRISPR-associated endoribonuclease Cas6
MQHERAAAKKMKRQEIANNAMRLRIRTTPNEQPVPFNYQEKLLGFIHKTLGEMNKEHDRLSLYTHSSLEGSRFVKDHLEFPHGATWLISFHDPALAEKLIIGALRESEICYGMRVAQITQQTTPRFGEEYTFKTASPVLARLQTPDGKIRHLTYADPEADEVLTKTLLHKMNEAKLDERHKNVRVSFDRTYRGAKTKLITIHNIHNRASVCPFRIEGSPEALQFAWEVGVGHSTGAGFGCLQ